MKTWIGWLSSLGLIAVACGGGGPDVDSAATGGASNASGGNASSTGGKAGAAGGDVSGGSSTGAQSSATGGQMSGTGASGGEAGSSSGGGAGETGEGPTEVELEPGTCGIVRRIPLPDVPLGHTVVGRKGRELNRPAFVQRMNGGFVVGPWADESDETWHIDWLWVSDDGTEQVKYSASPTRTGWPSGLFAMRGLEDLTWVEGSQGSSGPYWGGTLSADAEDYSTIGVLLENALGTLRNAPFIGVSLDGERGLLVTGATSQKIATFSKEGSLVGAEQELELAGDCWRHIATEHGSAFLDGSHLVEFASSGEILLDYELEDVARGNCPEAVLTEDGFAILSYHDDNLWRIHRVDHDGSASQEELAPSTGFGTPLAFGFIDRVPLVVTGDEQGVLYRIEEGRATAFALPDLARARPVNSELGRLFLDLENKRDPGVMAREIVEIGCAE